MLSANCRSRPAQTSSSPRSAQRTASKACRLGLPLGEEHVLSLHKLPPLHRDPFDRLLVCQAIVDGLVLVTPDDVVTQYPVRTLW